MKPSSSSSSCSSSSCSSSCSPSCSFFSLFLFLLFFFSFFFSLFEKRKKERKKQIQSGFFSQILRAHLLQLISTSQCSPPPPSAYLLHSFPYPQQQIMRYMNWDVLLFPDGSKVPLQEFKTGCFVTQDLG